MKNELSSLHHIFENSDEDNVCPACPKVSYLDLT